MKSKFFTLKSAMAVVVAAAMSCGIARAQNSAYVDGDLVLFFQQEGGAKTIYVGLGNAATGFRGPSTGPDVANRMNLININSQLVDAFGSTWQGSTNVYAGLAGVWGTSGGLSSALQDGDPNRTLYISQPRAVIGTVGQPESGLAGGYGDGGMSTGANAIVDQNNVFRTLYDGAAVVSPVGDSRIDDNNPFLAPGVQDAAFGIFAGGVQQVGTSGTFGTFGPVPNVEFALDLYRVQARNNIAGQVGHGEPVREGSYEGTVVIDSMGNVHFITQAPAPSTFTLSLVSTTNGSITGLANGGVYTAGATATLTAVPDLGYDFTGWTGSASGSANPLSVLMDGHKTVGADFSKASNYDALVPTISTADPLPFAQTGRAYSLAFGSTGGVGPFTWSLASGSLPAGMSLGSLGMLGGTPTTAGSASFSVRVTGSNGGSHVKAFTLDVLAAPVITTSAALPGGIVGRAYSVTLAADGGTTPYTWSVVSGSLPGGLSLAPHGVLGGTPGASGSFSFTLRATGANGAFGQKVFSLGVRVAPTISTITPLPAGVAGAPYSRAFAATGGVTPYTWSIAAGALPPGMAMNSAGTLSGTPGDAGVFSFTARVDGADAAASAKAMKWTVMPAAPVFSFASNTVTMTTTTAGSTIRFTTDGTEPTASSNAYNPATRLVLPSGKWTVKAKAFKNGVASLSRSANYTVFFPVTAFSFNRSSAVQPDGRTFTHYFTQQVALARTNAPRTVFFRLVLPSAPSREGGLACFHGMQMLRDLVQPGDTAAFKFGGEAPYDGQPANVWTPMTFSAVPNIELQPGTYFFKLDLAGTDSLPVGAPTSLRVWMNVQVARLLNHAGVSVASFAPSVPIWLVIHGSGDGENGMREVNNALRQAEGTTQVFSVDWSRPAAQASTAGQYVINLGRNLEALLTASGIQPGNINLTTHSSGGLVGFETAFRLGGVNRFIALDPATLSSYDNNRVHFGQATLNGTTVDVSQLATAVKSGPSAGVPGSDLLAGRADLTLRLLSSAHTGGVRTPAFYGLVARNWFVRTMTLSSDAYWPFLRGLMLTSHSLPWTSVDMGGGFDFECLGPTNFVDNPAPTPDVATFQNHAFLRFKNPSNVNVEARASVSGGGTVWSFTPKP